MDDKVDKKLAMYWMFPNLAYLWKFAVLGEIAHYLDKDNPSWVPSVNLGYKRKQIYTTPERYERRQKREQVKSEHTAARSLLQLSEQTHPVEIPEVEEDFEQELPRNIFSRKFKPYAKNRK